MTDIDGNGKLDAIVKTSIGGINVIGTLLGNGDGTLQAPKTFDSAGISGFDISVGDINGDGRLDVALPRFSGTGAAAVFLGNGNNTFQAPTTFFTDKDTASVAIADVNGDTSAKPYR